MIKDEVLAWAEELRAIAQAGLFYPGDAFDKERFQQILELSDRMLARRCGISEARVKNYFLGEQGYVTPKLATRALLLDKGKILLVRENNGFWSLPGGWVEAELSPGESCLKELREEAGLEGEILRLLAVFDRKKHINDHFPLNVTELFFLLRSRGGEFVQNSETVERRWFFLSQLPPLSPDKNTKEELELCLNIAKNQLPCFFE